MTTKAFIVLTDNGKTICDSDDLFKALDALKKEPPGAKLIRASDRKTLAYTTVPKPETDPEPAYRSRRR